MQSQDASNDARRQIPAEDPTAPEASSANPAGRTDSVDGTTAPPDGFAIGHRSPTSAQSFTSRSLILGLVIGTLITFSNTYFGLQTGWISSMAMPSSLIGFSVFKGLSKHLSFPFTPIENVLVQTVAGAVGTMPLGCGFVGVIPALQFLLMDGEDGPAGDGGAGEGGPLELNFWKLCIWSLGVCLFGVVFAVPLRKEVIIREKLKFPSGTASALMIRVLHGNGRWGEKTKDHVESSHRSVHERTEDENPSQSRDDYPEAGPLLSKDDPESQADRMKDWKSKMRLLIGAFVVSGVYVRLYLLNLCDFCRRPCLLTASRLSSPTLSPRFVICPSLV